MKLSIFFMILVLITAVPANAILAQFTIEDLTKLSKYIIIGNVVNIKPVISDEQAKTSKNLDVFLYDVTLTVENDLHNQYNNETIKFRIMNNRDLDSISGLVEDSQKFQVNERVLVFVADKEPHSVWGDNYYVTGTSLGKYVLANRTAYGVMHPSEMNEMELISMIKHILFTQQTTNDETKMSPLKQFKLGIPIEQIQCQGGLILVTKSNNGHPAS